LKGCSNVFFEVFNTQNQNHNDDESLDDGEYELITVLKLFIDDLQLFIKETDMKEVEEENSFQILK
jgi:hypothetical protein